MERFAAKVFHVMFLCLAVFLFVGSLLVTGVHVIEENGIQENAIQQWNKPTTVILLLVVGCFLTYGLSMLFDRLLKVERFSINCYAAVVCVLSFGIAVAWMNLSHVIPGADQETCTLIASGMNHGETFYVQHGYYLGSYPHLLGLVAVLRLIYRIFGDLNYLPFRYFNALCIPLLIVSGWRITHKLSKGNRKAELFYLTYMLFCFPAYGYVHYIYGELTGTAFAMLATWMFLNAVEKVNVKNMLLLFVTLLLAIAFRKTALILAVALLIVSFITVFRKKNRIQLVTLAVLVVTVFFSNYFVKLLYYPTVPDDQHGVPASACIAMGLNDDGGYAGYYNYYELIVYAQNDYDPERTSKAAMEVITKEYIPDYLEHPGKALDFFFRKINGQWQVPMYQALVMNNVFVGEQNAFVMSVHEGRLNWILNHFMKIYQMFLYGTIAFWFILGCRQKEKKIEDYTLLIGVFGGFLLSMVWESKGRYIFPYFLMLIPYYATSTEYLLTALKEAVQGKRKKTPKAVE